VAKKQIFDACMKNLCMYVCTYICTYSCSSFTLVSYYYVSTGGMNAQRSAAVEVFLCFFFSVSWCESTFPLWMKDTKRESNK
jgi:hypothetical protein